jgi:hypothetical protein
MKLYEKKPTVLTMNACRYVTFNVTFNVRGLSFDCCRNEIKKNKPSMISQRPNCPNLYPNRIINRIFSYKILSKKPMQVTMLKCHHLDYICLLK